MSDAKAATVTAPETELDEIEVTLSGPPGKDPYQIIIECGDELNFLSTVLGAVTDRISELTEDECPMRGLSLILRDLQTKLDSVHTDVY